uniref:Transposase n=1 Tax=Ascaris lumbricoides TaxID=6252 RepID=A0A0M3I602_ASCLU
MGGWRRIQLVHAGEGPDLKMRTHDCQRSKVAIQVEWERRKKVVQLSVPASFAGEDIVLGMNAIGLHNMKNNRAGVKAIFAAPPVELGTLMSAAR